MKRLAIIGAGAAGLATAWKLRQDDLEITIFEKSRGLCGRAASKTVEGVRVDQGANYFKTDTPEVEDLIQNQLPTDDLFDIGKDIWTFDKANQIQPGDPEQNAEPKWNYRGGISTLGKLLAAECKAAIRQQVRINHLEQGADGWTLVDVDEERHGPFDTVLMTPPAPQAVQLLEDGSYQDLDLKPLLKNLERTKYHTQLVFVLGYEQELERPGDFYALINSDRSHLIAWLSFENDKPERVPEGQTAIVVQMHPGWSELNYDRDEIELTPDVTKWVNQLLGWEAYPDWIFRHGWRFAHPHTAANSEMLQSLEPNGLYFAGDALVGKGRVNQALQTGLEAADRIRAALL